MLSALLARLVPKVMPALPAPLEQPDQQAPWVRQVQQAHKVFKAQKELSAQQAR